MRIKQQKGKWCTLAFRKERKKKHTITGDNSSTTHLHVPCHVEKKTVAHLVRWWMIKIGHRVMSHALLEIHVYNVKGNFFFIFSKVKNMFFIIHE